ncbi:hypothetical protein GCM10025867_47580 (plasmid) [Frondihabitans sucicola]|uniref:Type II toxin-antitoxin system prevent-host-death family antitoxin n=1 Tax=Frondihabitans sucicola TaxID=1268041 RepID=A0ABM8GVK9_9MICO|nr:hypothetical protein [Frondihabitans sucicola]BDZ52517.1 hypothetical protein GCM10025867_47580 [Frondihabitans sucicola]
MQQETTRIYLDTHKIIQVGPGSPVTVRDELGRPFVAIVTAIREAEMHLTFTPKWAARRLPLAHLISAGKRRVADIARVPDFQEEPTHV